MAWNAKERDECYRLLTWGLAEDFEEVGDLTSMTVVPQSATGSNLVVSRQKGVVAGLEGLPMLAAMAPLTGDGLHVEILQPDGPVEKGTAVARIAGNLRAILGIERLTLNLLGRLSGIATLTAEYVRQVAGTKAKICDTRKTTPGWRHLEKYAVRVGGGTNHRMGLFDGVLIKDNHIAGLAREGDAAIATALRRAKAAVDPATMLEVEVDNLQQLGEALAEQPQIVLLDNMSLEQLAEAVRRRDEAAPGVLLEASGGVNLHTVAGIARTGVDRISVGALTHSAIVLDLGLDDE